MLTWSHQKTCYSFLRLWVIHILPLTVSPYAHIQLQATHYTNKSCTEGLAFDLTQQLCAVLHICLPLGQQRHAWLCITDHAETLVCTWSVRHWNFPLIVGVKCRGSPVFCSICTDKLPFCPLFFVIASVALQCAAFLTPAKLTCIDHVGLIRHDTLVSHHALLLHERVGAVVPHQRVLTLSTFSRHVHIQRHTSDRRSSAGLTWSLSTEIYEHKQQITK